MVQSRWTHRDEWAHGVRVQWIRAYFHDEPWWGWSEPDLLWHNCPVIYVQQMLWKSKLHMSLFSGEKIYNCMPALEANHSGEKWRHNSLILPQSWQRLVSMVILLLPRMFAPWLFSLFIIVFEIFFFNSFWHHDHQYTQAVIGCST